MILIIDDEKDFCRLVKMNLELLGNFKVLTAFSGREGIKIARETKPDLILLDIMMPKMNGFEVLRVLKRNRKTLAIPVVVLTAKDDDVSKLTATKLYNEEYITKPIGAGELKDKIEEVFKRSKGSDLEC